MSVRFPVTARQEFKDAVLYYNAQPPRPGAEFSDEVKASIKRIVQHISYTRLDAIQA